MHRIGLVLQFLDKARQKAREKRLKEKAAVAAIAQPVNRDSHIKDQGIVKARRAPAAKRRLLEGRQDVSDIASDYALLKKLKKGKLSEVSRSHFNLAKHGP